MHFDSELCQIAYRYRTDKCPQIRHSYTPLYYRLLNPQREEVKKVLELGIGTPARMVGNSGYQVGAGLKMWRDFFPQAEVYGVDIDPDAMFTEERIKTFQYNVTDGAHLHELLENIGTDIDLVIDDASHLRRHQIITCHYLMKMLNPGVFYFIEDIRHPKKLMQELGRKYNCLLFDGISPNRSDKMILVRHK